MKALLLKDFIIQKRNLVQSLLILLLLIAIWHVNNIPTETMFLLGSFIIPYTLVQGGLAYDESNEAIKFLLTLPVSRTQIIVAKYLTGIITVLFGTLLNGIILNLLTFELGPISIPSWPTIIGSIIGNLVILALSYIIYYRFGYRNLRFVFVGIIAIIATGIVILMNIGLPPNFTEWVTQMNPFTITLISVLLCALVYIGSLYCSVAILKRKEF